MHKAIPYLLAAIVAGPQTIWAATPSATGTAAAASEPGKAIAVVTTDISATVVAIDRATRTATLKGPQGKTLDVVAGEEVRNFDQIRVGDAVEAQYQEALSLELKKTRAPGTTTETVAGGRAAPGQRPAGVVAREVTVLADVVAVDVKKSIISLKGPRGNVVDLKVQNPDHFKVVQVGDQVEAVYSEALAVRVTPSKKAAGQK
jgi:hypothetical protein